MLRTRRRRKRKRKIGGKILQMRMRMIRVRMRMKKMVSFLQARVTLIQYNTPGEENHIACIILSNHFQLTYRFKTVDQLLQEQNEGKGENEEEPKPVIFTDHTGRIDRKVDASMGFALSSVDRKAVGFEVI